MINQKPKKILKRGVIPPQDFLLSPLRFETEINILCEKIDVFYSNYAVQYKNKKASDLIKGIFYAIRPECRTNSDWMSQAANSAREVLYPLLGENISKENLIRLLKRYTDENRTIKIQDNNLLSTFESLNQIYRKLSDLTHHGTDLHCFSEEEYSKFTEKDFEALIYDFSTVLKKILELQQIFVHNLIDCIFQSKNTGKTKKEDIDFIFSINKDAKAYFFAQADGSWLKWIYKNGFLDRLNKKEEDSTKYTYHVPELEYLTRMAGSEGDPAEVARIIYSIKISQESFNPGVIDCFLRIISILPAEQIGTITIKIWNENWIYLTRDFRKTGYDFEQLIKKLVEKKENNAILELARAMLTVKNKTEMDKKDNLFFADDPFYISNLDESGIFEALINIEESHTEEAFKIVTDKMAEIVKLAKPAETKTFKYSDSFLLYDTDFFTLQIENKRSSSLGENVKNLAATTKELIEKTIVKKSNNPVEVKRLFGYIDKLPSCRSTWRLRLFTLAQCPKVFKKELKDAFFKLFKVDNYYEIEGGTEYKKALKIAFPVLSKEKKNQYIAEVFRFFAKKNEEHPDQDWHKRTGWEILSCIYDHLTDDELKKCEDIFGNKCDKKYKPRPIIGNSRGGSIHHRSPVDISDFSVDQIIKNLKSEWAPENLNEQYKNEDFLNPRGAEGLGDDLKEDIKKRTNDYLKNINSFFDREKIHSHYVYSLLRGIEEMLRNKQSLDLKQTSQILNLFKTIEIEGEMTPFIRKDDKSWLIDWIEVHNVITDILLHILEDTDKEKKETIHKEHREQIKSLIAYLFTIKDSPSKEQEKPEYGDPYQVAINSVRGRAYESFVAFTENDGKKLKEDIKTLYIKTLCDDSLAVRFVIGRYLAFFYFRDKEFMISLFPKIFPKDEAEKKDIYFATWEGYLSNTLYDKLFVELNDYYHYAITLNPKEYTQRKYLIGLDESLADHLALSFAHLDLKRESPLFKHFWNISNTTRHKEFISFIGRSCLTRSQAGDDWLKENKVSKKKLVDFWEWAIKNITEPEVLSGFGFWVNPDKEVLSDDIVVEEIAQTLKKSGGDIEWEHGLMKRLTIFAEKNSDKTLEIISSYLLNSENNLNQKHYLPILYNNEIKKALMIIYKKSSASTKQKVVGLINTLIEKGSEPFWYLKEVISEG
jgi:hypothetical protein